MGVVHAQFSTFYLDTDNTNTTVCRCRIRPLLINLLIPYKPMYPLLPLLRRWMVSSGPWVPSRVSWVPREAPSPPVRRVA